MRDHATVSPLFWTGETGRYLRQHPDAQRLAFYLMTCPSSNMIGLYYLPMPTICHELCLSEEGASKALRRVSEGGFARFEIEKETVFVPEMARFQVGETLKPKDNRVIAIEKMLYQYRKSCFFREFLQKYRDRFCLNEDRIYAFKQAPSEALRRGSLQEQEQEQEQECKSDGADMEKGLVGDKPHRKKFVKPTFQEVKAYCDERKNGIDPQRFLDHYESNGWKVGRNGMKDWRASVRTWEKNSNNGHSSNGHAKHDEPNRPKFYSDDDADHGVYNGVTGVMTRNAKTCRKTTCKRPECIAAREAATNG